MVDSGSQDNTERLAKEAGARFIYHPMGDDGFAGQRNFALEQINTDWVFIWMLMSGLRRQLPKGFKM